MPTSAAAIPVSPPPRPESTPDERRIRLINVLPILFIHFVCLGVIFVGWSPLAILVAVLLFLVRMFCITAFYHRYFSHRTFRTHRLTQFVFAFIGVTAAQRGPAWWAAHHRHHHRHADHEPDVHSPSIRGLIWSHTGWFLTDKGIQTDWNAVPDWAKYPELRWLEKYHLIGPYVLIAALSLFGYAIGRISPSTNTGAWQMLVWGFGISTTLLYHATFTINSLAHTVGSRRFLTADDSRNNWFLALLTLGEGWHNNHHYFPASARQGFYWWEFDPTYYILRVMQTIGLVWDLRPVPARVYAAAIRHTQAAQSPAPSPDAVQ